MQSSVHEEDLLSLLLLVKIVKLASHAALPDALPDLRGALFQNACFDFDFGEEECILGHWPECSLFLPRPA